MSDDLFPIRDTGSLGPEAAARYLVKLEAYNRLRDMGHKPAEAEHMANQTTEIVIDQHDERDYLVTLRGPLGVVAKYRYSNLAEERDARVDNWRKPMRMVTLERLEHIERLEALAAAAEEWYETWTKHPGSHGGPDSLLFDAITIYRGQL